MDRKIIVERITPIVREVFEDPNLEISESLDASQVNAWTSLTFMQLLGKVEEEFGFKFSMMELIKIRTMGDLVNVVMQH